MESTSKQLRRRIANATRKFSEFILDYAHWIFIALTIALLILGWKGGK